MTSVEPASPSQSRLRLRLFILLLIPSIMAVATVLFVVWGMWGWAVAGVAITGLLVVLRSKQVPETLRAMRRAP